MPASSTVRCACDSVALEPGCSSAKGAVAKHCLVWELEVQPRGRYDQGWFCLRLLSFDADHHLCHRMIFPLHVHALCKPLLCPRFTLITSVKTLPLSMATCEVPGVRTSLHEHWTRNRTLNIESSRGWLLAPNTSCLSLLGPRVFDCMHCP